MHSEALVGKLTSSRSVSPEIMLAIFRGAEAVIPIGDEIENLKGK
jgi:hypothetical protein